MSRADPHPPPPANDDEATRRLTSPLGGGGGGSTDAAVPATTSLAQRAAQALPSGTVLHGKFEVVDLIGEPGGFGIAYLCRDLQLERTVVVKELFPLGMVSRALPTTTVEVLHAQLQPQFELQLALLLDEARRLAALDQVDAVVTVHDHFSENNTAYIVMHHVFGKPLAAWLREPGPRVGEQIFSRIGAAQLMRWIWPLLAGLEAVHDAGVLHRDIKPDNVLIDQRDRPVLIDFGNAVAHGLGAAGTLGTTTLSGAAAFASGYHAVSPFYGAPEQYRNDASRMGPWTDLYSLGALMYVALSGQRPVDALKRLAGAPQVAIHSLAPEAPRALLDAITACLQLDERQRPQDVRALRQMLAPLQPAQRHWLELLPPTAFGQRMRALHAQHAKGRALPGHWRLWSLPAALMQSFWFFGHRLPLAGVVNATVTLAGTTALLWNADPWPNLLPAVALMWAASALPCAWVAELLRHRRVAAVAQALPLGNDEQAEQAGKVLARLAHADWRQALLGLTLPLGLAGVAAALHQQQQATQRQVAVAVELASQREAFAAFVAQHSRPPAAGELPPFTPNSELRSVELRPSGLEVVLALPGLEGRRVRWLLGEGADGGQWRCESVDLPQRLAPAACGAAR